MPLNQLSDWNPQGNLSAYPQSGGQQGMSAIAALLKIFQQQQQDSTLRKAASGMMGGNVDLPANSITQEDFGKMAVERAKPQSQEWHPKSLEEALSFEKAKKPTEWHPQSLEEALSFEKAKVKPTGGIKEEILRKMATGETITPEEQKIYDEIIAKEKEFRITGSDVNALKPGFFEGLFNPKANQTYQKAKGALGQQVTGNIKRGKTSSGIGFTIGE